MTGRKKKKHWNVKKMDGYQLSKQGGRNTMNFIKTILKVSMLLILCQEWTNIFLKKVDDLHAAKFSFWVALNYLNLESSKKSLRVLLLPFHLERL